MVQTISNWKTVFVWVVSIVLVCVIWWIGPSVYVSVQNVIPTTLRTAVSGDYAKQTKRIGQLQARVQKLRQENKKRRLTVEAGFFGSSSVPDDYTGASVIARPPLSPYDTLLIDTGSDSEAEVGSPVWWPPGVYLGKVREVRTRSALVTLVSAPNQRHSGRVDNTTIKTVGRGGGKIQAVVPEQLSVSTSSQVVSDRYGLVYGSVEALQPGSLSSQKRLLIQPVVPASVIEYVYVGKE